MGLFTALRSAVYGPDLRSLEGEPRPGPWVLPISGGVLSAEDGQYLNFWQMGRDVQSRGPTAVAEACISAYSQTVAMCPGAHWRLGDDGGRQRVTNSAASRVLRRPNGYQTSSDFLLNAVRNLLADGNAFAVCQRNDRGEVRALHLCDPRVSQPVVADDGSLFYSLCGNPIVDRMLALGGSNITVPASDVLHIRLHSNPANPLRGVSPIAAVGLEMAAGNAALMAQVQFFANQSRPSYVLSTDQPLTRTQMEELSQRWEEKSKGLARGGTPILSHGLKPTAIGVSAEDAQLIQLLKLSDEAVAQVYRVPLAVVGLDKSPLASAETLMNFWRASGLGFVLNHVETALDRLFDLPSEPGEYIELDANALARTNFRDRIEGMARAAQSGLYSPDEARAELELPAVPGGFGRMPRVQQQVVPLSFAATLQPGQAPTPDQQNSARISELEHELAELRRRLDEQRSGQ